jgi:hypothetical protein
VIAFLGLALHMKYDIDHLRVEFACLRSNEWINSDTDCVLALNSLLVGHPKPTQMKIPDHSGGIPTIDLNLNLCLLLCHYTFLLVFEEVSHSNTSAILGS